tara:strand:+ start:958 stop:1602 length:645 start_codon:yes stop_codon:yes gene_type:complete
MEEDLAIINSNTRNEKIKNFFINNKKKIIIFLSITVLFLIGFFGYNEFKDNQKIKLSNLYNSTIINYSDENKALTTDKLVDIINKEDPTYSPLSLYFIIDNNLIKDKKKINDLFDILIKKISLEKEIKNLIIYKKALFNADDIVEKDLLDILKPIINSESVWKSHALYLLGEYFYSKNEKQKSKEFFNQIITLDNSNYDLKVIAQKRLNRDLSE